MSLGRKIFLLKPTLIYLIRKSSFILLYAHLSWLLNLKIYKLKENSPINRKQKASVIKETKEWHILCCFVENLSMSLPLIPSLPHLSVLVYQAVWKLRKKTQQFLSISLVYFYSKYHSNDFWGCLWVPTTTAVILLFNLR